MGVIETQYVLLEVLLLRDVIAQHEDQLTMLRQREAVAVQAMKASLARSAGSAARETPGASTGPRT